MEYQCVRHVWSGHNVAINRQALPDWQTTVGCQRRPCLTIRQSQAFPWFSTEGARSRVLGDGTRAV